MPKKALSPTEVYKYLPRTNCKECGEENCMAFAAKLVNREVALDKCPPLSTEKYKEARNSLWEMLKPPVREVTIGSGEKAVKIGGKLVMYRHELTYFNPTAIAIDVSDDMAEEEIEKRVKGTEGFSYDYIGQKLKLDLLAIRSATNDMKSFGRTVKKVASTTSTPLILCSLDPNIMEAGLIEAAGRRPLIYAATKENWKEMAELALMYKCPLAVYSPNDLAMLRSLTKTLLEYGIEDLVLDPGAFWDDLPTTLNNFTMLRRKACKEEDELSGFPLIGVPATVWMEPDGPPEVTMWKEVCLASMLIVRFADALIMRSFEGWTLLPLVILRQNLYTDPRKPVSVEPGLRSLGSPNENSPVMVTTNFALTYYTVACDIESAKVDCYLLVVDTEGISVESAIAGRKLTAEKVANALKETEVEKKVKHKMLIIPGRASRLSGEIEELTGWKVLVGPMDSSGIPKFVQEKWRALKAT